MATLTLEESDFVPLEEDDVYEAEVVAVTHKKENFQDKETGKDVYKYEFKFLIDDETSAWDGKNIYGKTGEKFTTHPDCRLYQWVQEILGAQLEPGFEVDTDELIGNRCRIVIGIKEYEKDGQPKTYTHVKDVMRRRGAMSGEQPF